MLSQNLEGGSNYASDMLILVYLWVQQSCKVHSYENSPDNKNSTFFLRSLKPSDET